VKARDSRYAFRSKKMSCSAPNDARAERRESNL
jgi:hypothetical protein